VPGDLKCVLDGAAGAAPGGARKRLVLVPLGVHGVRVRGGAELGQIRRAGKGGNSVRCGDCFKQSKCARWGFARKLYGTTRRKKRSRLCRNEKREGAELTYLG
jgi:hypothetical protein